MNEVPVSYLVFDLLALERFRPARAAADVAQGVADEADCAARVTCARSIIWKRTVDRCSSCVARSAWKASWPSARLRPTGTGPRRTDDWVKLKSERDDEFVVIGFMRGKGGRAALGALCVASYSGERLLYRGRVGSGLDVAALSSLRQALEARRVERLSSRR